jgi:Ca-activated chloride channel family protein
MKASWALGVLGIVWIAFVLPSRAQNEPSSTVRVNVKLVNVFVSVTDPNGAPVGGLGKENFRITEDGIPQNVAVFARESELPLSVVLAVDTSLSTKKDIKLELDAARRFVHSILRPVDKLSLYQFDELVQEIVPFTARLDAIDRGLDRMRIGSATALYDAVYLGAGALEKREGRKVMVVITDGGDTASNTSYHEALRAAVEAEAILYSVIIVPIESSAGRNTGGEHALIQMAHDTGGKYFYAGTAAQLDRVFREISEELRTQYLLAYYPKPRLAESEYRHIDVQVMPPASVASEGPLLTRHRTGYYTMPGK